MRILKILLVLLIPAMGFVACEKSNTRPCSEKPANAQPANSNVSGKVLGSAVIDESSSNGTTIVGSGDDDRDGGDKKKKVR